MVGHTGRRYQGWNIDWTWGKEAKPRKTTLGQILKRDRKGPESG